MTSTTPESAVEPGSAVDQRSAGAWLGDALAIDGLNTQRLALIKNTVAKDANVAEVGMFLELAAKYDLDPFAKEIWCAKGAGTDGGSGKLLIMVGRDGLRKIAQRNGMDPKGDVVRAEDEYGTEWIDSEQVCKPGEWDANGRAPFHRVTHRTKGMGKARGAIVGAWCRVVHAATGREAGWFEADIEEYKPTSAKKLQYSPWGTQEGVMMLAAVERQAVRQSTPLAGVLVEGEGEINEERALGPGSTPQDLEAAVNEHVPEALRDRAMDLISQVNALAPGQWSPGKVNMVFAGKTAYAASVELSAIEKAIEELHARPQAAIEDEDIPEAEVVDEPKGAPAREGAPAATSDSGASDEDGKEEAGPDLTADQQTKAARLNVLVEQRDEDDSLTEQQQADIDAEIEVLEGELPPDIGPGQGSLPL